MKKSELVKWIHKEITISGALKIDLPDAEIERVIENETKMCAELYPDMIQDSYTILPVELFRQPWFRETRTIQFPSCVKSIVQFEEMKRRASMMGFHDADLTFNRAFMSDVWFGGPWNMDTITYRTLSMSVWDQMKAFNLVDIQYSYNRNTHKLLVEGHDPLSSVFVRMNTVIPDEDAWEDPWVRKWIAAKCKLSVYPMLGLMTTNLIGGVTINANIYKELADADIENCKEYWKNLNQATYFLDFP